MGCVSPSLIKLGGIELNDLGNSQHKNSDSMLITFPRTCAIKFRDLT